MVKYCKLYYWYLALFSSVRRSWVWSPVTTAPSVLSYSNLEHLKVHQRLTDSEMLTKTGHLACFISNQVCQWEQTRRGFVQKVEVTRATMTLTGLNSCFLSTQNTVNNLGGSFLLSVHVCSAKHQSMCTLHVNISYFLVKKLGKELNHSSNTKPVKKRTVSSAWGARTAQLEELEPIKERDTSVATFNCIFLDNR